MHYIPLHINIHGIAYSIYQDDILFVILYIF
jgi:hypothetical protein